jgi:tRNA G18 (ribose-2'-O)-methylase SpoU
MKTCVLILDNIRSVENTGSIFRTAEGLGVAKIYLIGTTPAPLDRFGRKRNDFAKVSLGAEDMVEWEYSKDAEVVAKELKQQNFQIVSLEQTPEAVSVKEFEPSEPFVLIVGNEVGGVSPALLKLSDRHVYIPMRGKKESFNVAVAAGIALSMLL